MQRIRADFAVPEGFGRDWGIPVPHAGDVRGTELPGQVLIRGDGLPELLAELVEVPELPAPETFSDRRRYESSDALTEPLVAHRGQRRPPNGDTGRVAELVRVPRGKETLGVGDSLRHFASCT